MSTFTYEVPEGTLYVTVIAAETMTDYQPGAGPVDRVKPLVRITTTKPGNDHPGYLKLRGRNYSVDYWMRPAMGDLIDKRTGEPFRWCADSKPYRGGYRNESNLPLAFDSPVDARLDAIRDGVLDLFASEHPNWKRESERLEIEGRLSHEQTEIDNLMRQIHEHQAKAASLQSRLDGWE